jgi:hypothetical protein
MNKGVEYVPKYAELYIVLDTPFDIRTWCVEVSDGACKNLKGLKPGEYCIIPISWGWEKEILEGIKYIPHDSMALIFYRELVEGWIPKAEWMSKPVSPETYSVIDGSLNQGASLGESLWLGIILDGMKREQK